MRRREFVFLAGGTVTWPLAALAQQSAKPVIGFLSISSPGPHAPFVAAFNEGLRQLGFIEGQNLAIEYRWAEGQFERLPTLAADLIRRKARCDRRSERRSFDPGGNWLKLKLDNACRFYHRRRPGPKRLCRQPGSAGVATLPASVSSQPS
jgi:hypothetical protein